MRQLFDRPGPIVLVAAGFAITLAGCEAISDTAPASHDGEAARGEEHADKTHGGHEGDHGEEHGGHEGGAGGDHANRSVELTKKAEQRYGLEVQEARGGNVSSHVSAPATVEHAPDQKQHVSPLVRGRISELKVTVGDRVDRGETVAVLRSIELGEARAAVEKANSELQAARSNLERVEKLKGQGIVSERRYLEAERAFQAAKADLASARSELETYGVGAGSGPYYTLESDIAGRIVEQHASAGEVKGPSESLFVVADRQPVWVLGEVFERDISKVEAGMEASVTLEAYPSRTWRGTVDWVADSVDRETRNLRIRVEVPNDDATLRPGMFGAVHLTPTHPEEIALVPVGSVQKVHGRQVVFVPGDEPRHYRARPVETGEEERGMVEIRKGLAPGDRYVAAGAFDLRATLTAASRSGGHHH